MKMKRKEEGELLIMVGYLIRKQQYLMTDQVEIPQLLKKHFPILSEPGLVKAIEEAGEVRTVPAGTVLMDIGSYVKFMPLVVEGAVKVLRENEVGNELFLYFLYPGQSCAMTVQCCVVNAPSQVRAIAEEDTTFIAIPIKQVDNWMREFNSWKEFILTTYSDRFSELLNAVCLWRMRKFRARESHEGVLHGHA